MLDAPPSAVLLSAMIIRVILFMILLWGSSIFAIAKGGRSERAVAIILLIAAITSYLALSTRVYHHIEFGVFMIDLITFAALFWVSLVSNKFWPMWVTAMHGVSLISHLGPVLPDVIPTAYAYSIRLWSWPMQTTLVVATWLHIRELRGERRRVASLVA